MTHGAWRLRRRLPRHHSRLNPTADPLTQPLYECVYLGGCTTPCFQLIAPPSRRRAPESQGRHHRSGTASAPPLYGHGVEESALERYQRLVAVDEPTPAIVRGEWDAGWSAEDAEGALEAIFDEDDEVPVVLPKGDCVTMPFGFGRSTSGI